MLMAVKQSQQESCTKRRHFVKMQLVNSCDRSHELDSRCAALGAVLTTLVHNASLSEKSSQATLQQYTTELQAVLKRITIGV